MRKMLLATTVLLGLAVPASANTLTLGPGSFSQAGCTPVCDGSFTAGSETNAILDTYAFDITSGMLLQTASATNSTTEVGEVITGFTIELFSGTPTGTHTLLATGSPMTDTPSEQTTGGLPLTDLSPGMYFLQLSGTNGGVATTYAGSYAFSPSAVPLPGALPLFATGLALLFFRNRRKQATSMLA